jgi:hypothetical protein
VHPPLLNPIQAQSPSPSPSPNHRRARIQLPQTRIVHGHAREKEMRSGGGHEGAASHANDLVIETTAVAVQGVDACGSVAMLPPYEGFLHRVCATKYLPATLHSIHGTVRQNKDADRGRLIRVYRNGGRRHKHTASDALVFIINATMSLPRSNFQ